MKALFVFPVRVCISVHILCLLIIPPLFASKGIVSHLQFKEYSTLNGLPNNDVQTLFQDSTDLCGLAPNTVCSGMTATAYRK